MTKKANISRNKSSGANISQSKSDGDAFVAFALASVDAFLLFDKGLNLINVNPAAKRLLGLSNKAVGGKNIRDVIPGLLEAEEYEKLLKVKRTGKTLFIDDITTNTASGDIHLNVKVFKVGDGLGMIASDITESSKRAKEQQTAELIYSDHSHVLSNFYIDLEAKEEALRVSEERFRSVTETAADAIILIDSYGNVSYWNHAAEKMFGYSTDELSGKPVTLIMPQRFHKAHNHGLNRVLSTENSKLIGKTVEVSGLRKDGSEFPVELSLAIFKTRKEVFFTAIVRDIIGRKQAEEDLSKTKQMLEDITQGITDGVMLLAKDLKVIWANKAILKQHGYSKKTITGEYCYKVTHHLETPCDHPHDKCPIEELKKSRKPVTVVHTHFDAKGNELYAEVTAYPIMDENGDIVQFVHLTRDITEQIRMQEALRHSEEYFRAITENVLDVILVLDSDATIRYKSPSLEKMLGPSRSGRNPFEFVHPDDLKDAADTFQKLIQIPDAIFNKEIRGQHRDGTWRFFEVIGKNLIDNPSVRGIVATFRDVTERKQAEAEKERMEQQLQLAGRLAAVGELAAGVAHELNNPLAAVQGYAQLLATRKDLEESIKSDVQTIYNEAQRASRITGNLLAFARRHKPEKSLISINEILEKSLELHAYRMRVNNIEIEKNLAPEIPLTMADFHQMQQVFVNIITNAEQAMTETHGRGRLSVNTRIKHKMIKVSFIDDGPGIPKEDLNKVFDPFFTTKDVGKGTGLGLSICYGIVHEHGGLLYAKSKPEEGSTFVVEIPIVSEEQAAYEQNDIKQNQGVS